jgi:dolichol-phosphate mannosyltransferase
VSETQTTLTVVVPCFNESGNVTEMVRRLTVALADIAWEVVFVDDNSPDGTARIAREIAHHNPRVRCIKRVGRRGLASAVIEGVLSSSAHYVAVIDGDLQHDETRLPEMLRKLETNEADVIVASRFATGGDAAGLADTSRHHISAIGIRTAQIVLGQQLTDPMSGFFMLRQDVFESIAPRLTGQGFKILLDLLLSSPQRLRVGEIGARFRPRESGESKLSPLVMVQFGALLLDKFFGGRVPLRFMSFAMVGAAGLCVHLAVLKTAGLLGQNFDHAQTIATLVAMIANFQLNNRLTYRDQRLKGAALYRGMGLFVLVCGVGAIANIGIAHALYHGEHATKLSAAATGAIIGLVWNYAVSSTLVWGRR